MRVEHGAAAVFVALGGLLLFACSQELAVAVRAGSQPAAVTIEELESGPPPRTYLAIRGYAAPPPPVLEITSSGYPSTWVALLSERRSRERPTAPSVFVRLPLQHDGPLPSAVTGMRLREGPWVAQSAAVLRKRFPDLDAPRLLLLVQDATPPSLSGSAVGAAAGAALIVLGLVIGLKTRGAKVERSKAIGRLFAVLAPVCGVGGLFFVLTALLTFADGALWMGLFFSALAVAGILGALSFPSRARQHLADAAESAEAKAARPPVLYLRSFQADDVTARSTEFMGKTEEELLTQVFGEFGPVVAIGKPGEELPALGAARVYVSDAQWKDVVSDYMSRAELVVLRLGATMGFWWELERSTAKLDPTKLILLTPYDRDQYLAFVGKAQPHFPRPLPAFVDGKYSAYDANLGSLRGALFFHPDWTAEYVDLKSARWPWPYFFNFFTRSRLPSKLKWALRPVYAQRSVAWKAPKVRWLVLAGQDFLACFVASVPITSLLFKGEKEFSIFVPLVLASLLLLSGATILALIACGWFARRRLEAA